MCAFKPTSPLIRETPEGQTLDSLEGVIERITFDNEENGYTVARLLSLPYDRRDIVAQCCEMGKVHSVDYGSETITVRADIAKDLAGRLARYTPGYVSPDI